MNTRLSRAGLPDLPVHAFDGSNRQWGKSDPPPAPDYGAAAQQTAAGNLDMARYATQANRPNEITPYGTRTWTNNSSFDQSAYDKAMASYNSALANQQSQPQGYYSQSYPGDPYAGVYFNSPLLPQGQGQNSSLVAPNAADFYSQGDNWTSTITLSPEMQALFDQQQKLQTGLFGAQDQALGRVNQTMGQGFDMSGVPQGGQALRDGQISTLNIGQLPGMGSVYDPTQSTNTATDAILSRVNPQLERDEASLRSQLANQGVSQGSQAWNNAMDELRRSKTDAYTQAGLQGIGLGMQQQGQTFGQQTTNQQLAAALQGQQFGQQAGLQGQQFAQSEQARQRAMQEQAYLRNLPLNELNALRTGNQVQQPQFGGFSQQATTAGPDMLGAAQGQYNAALGASNASNASSAGTIGGLFGIGGSLLQGAGAAGGFGALFSDRRLKTNIQQVGTADNGLPIYSYKYVWGGPVQLGYMADEVEQVAPDAVGELEGFKTVDYSKVH